MKHILASALVLGLSCLAGCDNEATVSEEATVSTPRRLGDDEDHDHHRDRGQQPAGPSRPARRHDHALGPGWTRLARTRRRFPSPPAETGGLLGEPR
jgi:hypothetical protein